MAKKTKKTKKTKKSMAKVSSHEKRIAALEKDNKHNRALWGHLINEGRKRDGKKPVKNAFDLPVSKALPWTKQLPS